MIEKTISSRRIFEGKIINLRVDEVLLPNGKTSFREIVEHPGAVAVVPLLNDLRVVLVQQYRKPIEQITYEIPAGKLEKGERAEECAIRELFEETGYRCRRIAPLCSFYSSPGFSNEILHVFLAWDLLEGEASPDEDEFVNRKVCFLSEAREMVLQGEIMDGKTVAALMLAWDFTKGGSRIPDENILRGYAHSYREKPPK